MLSIIYMILFLGCLGGILYYPKTKGRINGIKAIVMGCMTICCYQALAAWLLNLVHIKVGLLSIGAMTLLLAVLLWVGIWKKKQWQQLFWRISDVVCLLVLIIFVLIISVHIFGVDLQLQYPTSEAASYFTDVMRIVREGSLEGTYFSQLMGVLWIELLAPILPESMYFQAFILADVGMRVLELCMFYVLTVTISDKKMVRYAAPVLGIAYFWGYPAYSYLSEGYLAWSNGVMIAMLMLYVALLMEKKSISYRAGAILLAAGALVGLTCDRLFLSGVSRMGEQEIYASMYGDLIFFVPALIYVLYYVLWKKKHAWVIAITSIVATLGTVISYICWYNGMMPKENYYKLYYYLWLLGWLLVTVALDIATETGELVEFFSYAGMIGVLAFIVLSNYDERMIAKTYHTDGDYTTKNFFSLYRYNADMMLVDYEEYQVSEDALAGYEYAIGQQEQVPILTEDITTEMWYDALGGEDSAAYSLSQNGLPDVLAILNENGIDKVVVRKDRSEYLEYWNYFDLCEAVFENEDVAVYTKPGNDWRAVYDMEAAEYAQKVELYTYVKDELAGEMVPLMARKPACVDFIMYEDITGNSSMEYYTWNYGERENIENLNAHGVKYVVLLKEDAYYEANHGYYEGQDILFENEAGIVVRCGGEEWFLAE